MAKPTISSMAITQTSPPVITGVCKVGEELTATPGVYESGEIKNTKWYYSENGGADWTVKGLTKSHLLTADDVGRVFKVADIVQEGEADPEEFDSAKTGVIYPADANIGTVSVTGPSTGVVDEAVEFTCAVDGDADENLLAVAWTVEDAEGQAIGNASIADASANPVSITFAEPAVACRVVATVSSIQTNVVDSPASGSAVYDSQVPSPPPTPDPDLPDAGDGPLAKLTDSVLEGVPFVGQILTIIPGAAQGGKEPYSTVYSWERGDQGTWHTIDGYDQEAYSPGGNDLGFSIRGVATIVDADGTELRLPTLGTTPVAEEPDPINPDSEFSGWAQYNIANLIFNYRRWHNRDLQVGMIDHQTFTIQGIGRLDDLGRAAATPTDGEILMVWDWLKFHWTGSMENMGTGTSGIFKLSCMGTGRFVPSGGVEALIVGLPPFAEAPEEEVEA